jgi:hypothetical protein
MDQDARQLLTLDAYVRACSSLQRRLVWRKRQKSTRPSTSLRLEERKEVQIRGTCGGSLSPWPSSAAVAGSVRACSAVVALPHVVWGR